MATQIITINNPVLADKAVNDTQLLLSQLQYNNNGLQDWFAVLYPKTELSEKENIPQYRISNERYENIVPNSFVKSLGFFLLEKDSSDIEQQRIYDFSLIVWFDSKRFLLSNPIELREHFILAILRMFYDNHYTYTVKDIIRDKDEVWQGIDNKAFLANDNPYSSFRIKFSQLHFVDCETVYNLS